MNPYLVIIVISICCFSCTSPKEGDINKLNWEVVETLSYPLDSLTKARTQCIEFYQGYLYFHNTYNNSIYKYTLNGELEKIIPTYKEGPNGIGRFSGFKVFSDTSLLVTAYGFIGFYLIDESGGILEKTTFHDYDQMTITPPTNSSLFHNKMIFDNEGVYFGNDVPGNWTQYSQDQINAASIEKWYDINSNALYSLPIFYPTDYLANGQQSFYHSRIKVDNQLVYSYAYSHTISIFTVENENLISSKHVDMRMSSLKEFEGEGSPEGIPEVLTLALKKGEYKSLYFDEKNKVYYRIGNANENEEDIQDGNLFQLIKNRTSPFIVVFDNDFNKIGEIELPRKSYNSDMAFTYDGFIYIAKSNFWNEDLSEDELLFDKLKISW